MPHHRKRITAPRKELDGGSGRKSVEKDLSAQQHIPEKDPRLSGPHEDEERAPGVEEATGQGAKETVRLIQDRKDLRFPPAVRVRTRADYLRIQQKGRRARGRLLIILNSVNDLPVTRFGQTVSRRVGNAVVRNRVRRQIREIQRNHQAEFSPGHDVVVVALPPAREAGFSSMEEEFLSLAARLGLSEEGSGP